METTKASSTSKSSQTLLFALFLRAPPEKRLNEFKKIARLRFDRCLDSVHNQLRFHCQYYMYSIFIEDFHWERFVDCHQENCSISQLTQLTVDFRSTLTWNRIAWESIFLWMSEMFHFCYFSLCQNLKTSQSIFLIIFTHSFTLFFLSSSL